eukprot:gene18983-25562_t
MGVNLTGADQAKPGTISQKKAAQSNIKYLRMRDPEMKKSGMGEMKVMVVQSSKKLETVWCSKSMIYAKANEAPQKLHGCWICFCPCHMNHVTTWAPGMLDLLLALSHESCDHMGPRDAESAFGPVT